MEKIMKWQKLHAKLFYLRKKENIQGMKDLLVYP